MVVPTPPTCCSSYFSRWGGQAAFQHSYCAKCCSALDPLIFKFAAIYFALVQIITFLLWIFYQMWATKYITIQDGYYIVTSFVSEEDPKKNFNSCYEVSSCKKAETYITDILDNKISGASYSLKAQYQDWTFYYQMPAVNYWIQGYSDVSCQTPIHTSNAEGCLYTEWLAPNVYTAPGISSVCNDGHVMSLSPTSPEYPIVPFLVLLAIVNACALLYYGMRCYRGEALKQEKDGEYIEIPDFESDLITIEENRNI